MTNFEPIYAALFALLSTATGVVTKSRKLLHWNDVPAELQPALFVIQKRESPMQQRGLPPKWSLQVDVYVYVSTNAQQDPDIVPAQLLNPLLGAVRNALPSDNPDEVCTLGGLVSHCWISGAIETSEGVLGDQEVAIIPIEILVP